MTAARRFVSNETVCVSAAIEEGDARLRMVLPELRERDAQAAREEARADALRDMRGARMLPRRPYGLITPLPPLFDWGPVVEVEWDQI